MTRLFKQHNIRETVSLDGDWEFFFPAKGTSISPGDKKQAVRQIMTVPGCWENSDEYKTYRGEALAVKVICLEHDAFVNLVFKGVSHTAVVFVDGIERGRHHNAYTPFMINAGYLSAGEHEIMVHISNKYGDISALHFSNDYYNYGGISRPVEMHIIRDNIFIQYVHAETSPDDDNKWHVLCRAKIVNPGDDACELVFRATLAGTEAETSFTAIPGETEVVLDILCSDISPWTLDNPVLYLLETVLVCGENEIDDLIERIGFRTIKISGQDILLNGEKVFPMGFNRHEDHPVYGCAIPLDVMRMDLELIKNMNANFAMFVLDALLSLYARAAIITRVWWMNIVDLKWRWRLLKNYSEIKSNNILAQCNKQ